MRSRRCIWIFLFAAVVAQVFVPARNLAQEFKASGKRKIVAQVRPVYPELARKMNISGTVRLVVTVAAAGNVVGSEVLGGSPVLVQSALDAVAKAKWEAASQQTKEVVEIKFQPDRE